MAYVRFGDKANDGTPTDVYIYMCGGVLNSSYQFELNIPFEAYSAIANMPKRCETMREESSSEWMRMTYEGLHNLMADVELFAEHVCIPEFLFERLEKQERQQADAENWAEKFLASENSAPLPEELPLSADTYPHQRQGLRSYIERIASRCGDMLPNAPDRKTWHSKSHLLGEVLEHISDKIGVNTRNMEDNWWTDTIGTNTSIACGETAEYDTFLDSENELCFLDGNGEMHYLEDE